MSRNGVPATPISQVAPIVKRLKEGRSAQDLVAVHDDIMQKFCDDRHKMRLEARMEFHRLGAPLATLEYMRRPEGDCEPVHKACWRLMYAFASQLSHDSSREVEPKRLSAQLPYYRALIVAELERQPLWMVATNWSMKFLSKLSTVEDVCAPLVSVPALLKGCIALITASAATHNHLAEDSPGPSALAFLQNLSLFPSTHAALRACGVLENMAVPLLTRLSSPEATQSRMAVRAGSIVCRMVGRDESGLGPELIQSNPVLVDSFIALTREILDAGPNGSVAGVNSDPATFVYDLSLLAKSDRNKPLLVKAVPLLVDLLEQRRENRKLCLYSIQTLAQLTFEPTAADAFAQCKPALLALLGNKRLRNRLPDDEARKDATFIAQWLNDDDDGGGARAANQDEEEAADDDGEAPAVLHDAPSRQMAAKRRAAPSVLGRMASGLRKPPAVYAPAPLPSSSAPPPPKPAASANAMAAAYVFLSYQWDAKPLVRQVSEALKRVGINTWIDDEMMAMGKDVLESMAEGVENASCVVVFFSDAYKESVNCRRECKFARKTNKPVVYVRAEPNYFPQGWLGLLMEETLWLDMSAADKLDGALVKLQREIEQRLNLKEGVEAVIKPLATGATTAIKPLEVADLKQHVDALVARLDALEDRMDDRLGAIEHKLERLLEKMGV